MSLRVDPHERVALIGPNGAGKSSLLNAVCGVVRPASGRVRIDGDDVTGATPAVVVRHGRQPGPRRPARLRDAAGRGQPPARCLRPILQPGDRLLDAPLPPPQAGDAGAARTCLHAPAEAAGAARATRRAHVRRRAADGRDRASADGGAAPAGDRRALARPRSARRRPARRVPRPPERRGRRRDPARRPERPAGVRALRARVRAGDGPDRRRGAERGAPDAARGAQRLPRRRSSLRT